jgi:hypothetical protein
MLHACAVKYGKAPSDYVGLTGYAAFELDCRVLDEGAREEEAQRKKAEFTSRARKGRR